MVTQKIILGAVAALALTAPSMAQSSAGASARAQASAGALTKVWYPSGPQQNCMGPTAGGSASASAKASASASGNGNGNAQAGASAKADASSSASFPPCPDNYVASNAYANAWSQAESKSMGFANADAFATAINNVPQTQGGWIPKTNCMVGSANAQASASANAGANSGGGAQAGAQASASANAQASLPMCPENYQFLNQATAQASASADAGAGVTGLRGLKWCKKHYCGGWGPRWGPSPYYPW